MLKLVRYAHAAHAFVSLVRDMGRTDEVFAVVADLDSKKVMQPVIDHLRTVEGGAAALAERPRVGALDLKALSQLPEGTLGRTYADHMLKMGFDPYFFPQLDVKDDADYVRIHLYETHDIWHTVTGISTDVAGELGLQAFYAAQLEVGFLPPVLLAAGMLNAALFDLKDVPARVDAVARGWRMGKAAKPLFGLKWSTLWSRNLVDLRRELGIHELAQTSDAPLTMEPAFV
jgi:ubiquinone biosynthesis protein COQ4